MPISHEITNGTLGGIYIYHQVGESGRGTTRALRQAFERRTRCVGYRVNQVSDLHTEEDNLLLELLLNENNGTRSLFQFWAMPGSLRIERVKSRHLIQSALSDDRWTLIEATHWFFAPPFYSETHQGLVFVLFLEIDGKTKEALTVVVREIAAAHPWAFVIHS